MRLIDRLHGSIAEQQVFYLFEFFPPESDRGRRSLQLRIDRLADMAPMAVGVTCNNGQIMETLELCKNIMRFCAVDVILYITCVGCTKALLMETLTAAKKAGVRNLLAIHGDRGTSKYNEATQELKGAVDIVKIARQEFGDYFTIGVAGFPEGLGPQKTPRDPVAILKEKVDAGADFCVSELFYDVENFIRFVKNCHVAGIPRKFPIIPGIMPIHSYRLFKSVVHHLHVSVPDAVMDKVEKIKDDPAAVLDFGVELASKMCLELINSGLVHGFHFYTFNLEYPVRHIVEDKLELTPQKRLPWRASANPNRMEEDVRPIFWANRPKSYILRTDDWGQFPSGRWGDATEVSKFASLNDSQLFVRDDILLEQTENQKRTWWGETVTSERDVFEVFAGFIDGSVPCLPWCEESLHLETSVIKTKLESINRAGYLTINSQPRVNASPSNHPQFGWGPNGGYVYQKAYIEFFTSPQKLRRIIDLLETPEFASKSFVYHATDQQGNSYTNSTRKKPCAVTWGVFPGKEVLQPTVVDPDVFMIWKDEAFALWVRGWATIYEEDSPSYNLLYDMHDQYFLVNIVDNNFINGDIFEIFDALIK